MAKSFLVRWPDTDLVSRLEARAKANRRSLHGEIVVALEHWVGTPNWQEPRDVPLSKPDRVVRKSDGEELEVVPGPVEAVQFVAPPLDEGGAISKRRSGPVREGGPLGDVCASCPD